MDKRLSAGEFVVLLVTFELVDAFVLDGRARRRAISPSKSSREAKLRYTEAYRK
jgi:hypothetical protein